MAIKAGRRAALLRHRALVYRDPGEFGDDRVYLVRQGVVRASYPAPTTPIEREAFRAVVEEEAAKPSARSGPLPLESLDEILLLMSWFRAHPEALRRTSPLSEWTREPSPQPSTPEDSPFRPQNVSSTPTIA